MAQYSYLITIGADSEGDAERIIRSITATNGAGWQFLGTVVAAGG